MAVRQVEIEAQHQAIELSRRLDAVGRAWKQRLAPRHEILEIVRTGHVTSCAAARAALSLPTA